MYGQKHVTKEDHKKPFKMNRGKDRRTFSSTADQTEKINMFTPTRPMRGGIRL